MCADGTRRGASLGTWGDQSSETDTPTATIEKPCFARNISKIKRYEY